MSEGLHENLSESYSRKRLEGLPTSAPRVPYAAHYDLEHSLVKARVIMCILLLFQEHLFIMSESLH